MKHIAFGLIVTMLLLACATSQKYDRELKNWVGKKETALLDAWGRPSAEKYLSDNSKIITYTKINEWFYPSEYYFYNDGWGVENITYDPFMNGYEYNPYAEITDTEVTQYCQTLFWIENGVITAWKWRGNNCVAR